MTAPLTIVSENSVRKIRDEREFNTFFRENPAAQVSTEPLFFAERRLWFNTNSCLQRILYYFSGTISTPVGASEEKLIWLFRAISFGSDTPEKLLFSLYEKYPDSNKQSHLVPLGFKSHDSNKATLDLSPSMRILKCSCQQYTQDGESCGRSQLSFP